MRPPSILYKMMWGKIERQAAFSEEAYGSGTPLNMRILYRKKGIRKIAQKEKIIQEKFCMKKSTKNKIKKGKSRPDITLIFLLNLTKDKC